MNILSLVKNNRQLSTQRVGNTSYFLGNCYYVDTAKFIIHEHDHIHEHVHVHVHLFIEFSILFFIYTFSKKCVFFLINRFEMYITLHTLHLHMHTVAYNANKCILSVVGYWLYMYMYIVCESWKLYLSVRFSKIFWKLAPY